MKILVFTGLFPNNVWPNQGLFIKERMRVFSQLDGVAVKVVAPVPYCPPILGHRSRYRQVIEKEIVDGLEVTHPRYLMTPIVGMTSYGVLLALSVLPHLKQVQRTFDFDVIDSHFVYPDGFAAVLLGKLLGKPVVISARGSDVNVYKDLPIIPYLLKYALNRADSVVAVSQALARVIEAMGVSKNKVTVIPNGVDSSKFYPEPQDAARQALGLGSQRVLLSVGHLTKNKGFDVLLHALKILRERRKGEEVQMMILGDGIIRKELELLAVSLKLTRQVRFVGAVPNEKLRFWYTAADVFCLASKEEGCPNVLMESLACGTPVVATKAGGIPEIINSTQLGILTERTPEAFSNNLGKALDRKWDRNAIASNAQQHSWDHSARILFKVFEEVVAHRSATYSAGFAKRAGRGRAGGVS